MRPATRHGLVAITALATLTASHYLRGNAQTNLASTDFVLGVWPNFAAAIAIPFVFIAIWSDQRLRHNATQATRVFRAAAVFACAGLIGWEFVQRYYSRRLVYDPYDIVATIVGALVATFLFRLIVGAASADRTADG